MNITPRSDLFILEILKFCPCVAKICSAPCPQVHELEVSPDKAPRAKGAELSRTFEQIIPLIIEEPDKEEDEMAANLHTGFHEGQQNRMFETIEVEFSTKKQIIGGEKGSYF